MNILALDTSLGAVSACVLDTKQDVVLARETIEMDRGHAEALLPLIDRVMAQVDGGFSTLGRVAVTVGPGSFTGIRIGISAARAFGLACEVPVVGVSTLAALAAPLMKQEPLCVVVSAIDARHGQIYVQAFTPEGRTLVTARIAPVRETVRLFGSGPLRIAGSAAQAVAIEAWTMGLKAEIADVFPAPDIAYVARLGLLADPSALAHPLYLKAPDAKPQNAKRIPQSGA
jgi:tRNA threonylcarbamoyladenosine biosynthesis protein TsaB